MPPTPRTPPAPVADEARAHHEEILLRFPPDDPGCLFRATLVCRAWRSLVTSPVFAGRYRALHGTPPPLLGFFENHHAYGLWFEPSTPTSPIPPIHPGDLDLFVLDCRHGLVLLRTPADVLDDPVESLVVWDPAGRRQWEFPPPEFADDIICDDAVVLCTAAGCDHLSCHGGRFLVAYVGSNGSVARAAVFSSESRAWSSVASCYHPELLLSARRPKAIVGNLLYFNCLMGSIIIQFDHTKLELSIIQGPPIKELPVNNYVLMKTEKAKTDMLGCAIMQESGLCLWSTETVPDGSVEWTQGRVIKLDMLLASNSSVIGFVDGIDVFYLGTESGIFTVDLKSGGVKNILPVLRKKTRNIKPVRDFSVIPYMSFYTPDQARTTSGQVGNADGDEWEKVGNGEKKGEQQQEEEAAQDHFNNGSKAFQDGDFVRAVRCLRRSLKIRRAHHGRLSPKCRDTYYRYGWALLRKAQARSASYEDKVKDLDLAWRMLHVARVILEKSPDRSREKVNILAALAKVSMQRDNVYSVAACLKALSILACLVEPYYDNIINLNKQTCLIFTSPESGDAKSIPLWKSRIQKLKRANVALLGDKGDDASGTEVDLEESSLAKDIQFVTDILLSALEKKLEGLEQEISTPVSEATAETIRTTGSTGTDLGAARRGIKRANVEQVSSEPSPKKFAEGSSSVKVDSSNSSDCHLSAPDSDGSVSE